MTSKSYTRLGGRKDLAAVLTIHLAALAGMIYAFELRSLAAFLICFVGFCQLPRKEQAR